MKESVNCQGMEMSNLAFAGEKYKSWGERQRIALKSPRHIRCLPSTLQYS